MFGMKTATSPDSAGWSSNDQSGHSGSRQYGNEAQGDGNEPAAGNLNLLRGFVNPLQNKVTRDGQPAKRRGPKPDSKPAQTRRQELNRQAQRTHRERKEHYIKALELEYARLRETFVLESAKVQENDRRTQALLQEQQQEIALLREILKSRGIAFEAELQQRKSALAMGSHGSTRGVSPNHSVAQSTPYSNMQSVPSQSRAGFSEFHQLGYANGTNSIVSGHSPRALHDPSPGMHHSNTPPELQEIGGIKDERMPDMPGIFEKDPQLGVDFILSLEETCRDHGEYLVRRSLNSPNEPEGALFSGHALMASIPPTTHIENTPAQKGGLQPTYPHQAPDASLQALNTLLDLSKSIKLEGYIDGGQVTPIMALQSLRGHQNYHSLTKQDVVGMIDAIRNKVRCYGFGAVMEDFELRDALTAIFATKPEVYASFGHDLTGEIEDMYS